MTDGGHSLEGYAKGALEAHIQILSFIKYQSAKKSNNLSTSSIIKESAAHIST